MPHNREWHKVYILKIRNNNFQFSLANASDKQKRRHKVYILKIGNRKKKWLPRYNHFLRGKIKPIDLHQPNRVINSPNQNLELDLETHRPPVSNTSPTSESTPTTCLTTWVTPNFGGEVGLLLENFTPPTYPVWEPGLVSFRPIRKQWTQESLRSMRQCLADTFKP